jgi:hypothetical protein
MGHEGGELTDRRAAEAGPGALEGLGRRGRRAVDRAALESLLEGASRGVMTNDLGA